MVEERWYFKWWTVFVALIILGPFAFPLLWKSKDFNLFWKFFLTVGFTIITIVMIWGSWKTVEIALKHFKEIGLIQ